MNRFKYPRTLHHPLSESVTSDDKTISEYDLSALYGKEMVATKKMDGECTTIYADGYTHARSMDSKYHPSRSWIKSFAATIGPNLGSPMICGENLYAKHSLAYKDLPSYFLMFSVWSEERALSWDQTVDRANTLSHLGLHTVEEVWRGILTKDTVANLWDELDTDTCEGLVFRVTSHILRDEFHKKVFKLVRPNHVQTDKHWMNQEVIPNALIERQT